MKKIIASILVILMSLMLFSGCGSKNPSPPNDRPPVTEEPPVTTPPDDEVKGTEISTFVGGYTDAKSVVWDAMSKKFEEDGNLAFSMASLGVVFADLSIVEIMLFDAIMIPGGNSGTGKLAMSDIEGWKRVNGNVIEFGYDYTYPEDNGSSKKGDHDIAKGKLDTKAGALHYEHLTERDGRVISKFIIEIVKNSNTSYSSQMLFAGSKDESGELDTSLSGLFMWFEGKDIITVSAGKPDNSSLDFEYRSIFNQKNVKPEEMAEGMKLDFKSSFIGGEAVFEQAEN